MEVLLAPKAGFCFGVRMAIEKTEEHLADATEPSYRIEAPVHNERVTRALEERGLRAATSVADIPEGTYIISAHGAAPEVYDEARQRGLKLLDTTCPIVTSLQRKAKRLQDDGYQVIILGERAHAEIMGVLGHLNYDADVISEPEEAHTVPIRKSKVALVSQTTHAVPAFEQATAILRERAESFEAVNTVCWTVDERVEAALEFAPTVEAMVVVGSRTSSNTLKLADQLLAAFPQQPCHLVTGPEELNPADFAGLHRVGVTAGASTPDWVIEAVMERLKGF